MSLNLCYPNRSQFLASYNRHQIFSFPNSIIYYISKNPSTAKLYQKLIQSCKYFFIKNPILVIHGLYFNDDCEARVNGKWIKINLKVFSNKFWITESLSFGYSRNKNVLSTVFEKIYRSNAKTVVISYQTISFDELLLISTNIENVEFWYFTVKYDDGTIVPFEKVFEILPKIKSMYFSDSSSSISSRTFKELLKIPHFLTLDDCKFEGISEDFDIESFYAYMKANNRTKFNLGFSDPLSEDLKNRLEQIVDEIVEDKNRDYKPPYIDFFGMNFEKRMKLYKLFK